MTGLIGRTASRVSIERKILRMNKDGIAVAP